MQTRDEFRPTTSTCDDPDVARLQAAVAKARNVQETVESIRKRKGGWIDLICKRWIPYEPAK